MGINKSTRPRVRRIATFVAALGALTMSSGIALMVTAAPANAANKVGICHATSSDSNPYVFISVDDDSAKLKGHLQHMTNPNKHWKSDGSFTFHNVAIPHLDGDAKRDFIGSFTDDDNVFHQYDGTITAADCDGNVEVAPAVADVEFTDPDCDNQNTASYEQNGEHVEFSLEGTVGPGEEVTVTATADEGYTFDDETTVQEFTHTFGPVEICDITSPPVTPQDPEFIDPTCDTDPQVVLPDPTPVTEVPVPEKKAAGPVIETADVDGIHYEVTGDLAPGGTVEVDATAIEPNVIAEGATVHWEHTFPETTDCTEVEVPETPEGTNVATPTVVHAGLTGAGVTQDLRGEQGLVLLVSGLVMMLIAGGLTLRPARGAARS